MEPKRETEECAANSVVAELKAAGSTAKPVKLDAKAAEKKNLLTFPKPTVRFFQRQMIPNELERKLKELMRKKDVVCLLLSYPPVNSVNKERHNKWIQDVSKIIHKVREMEKYYLWEKEMGNVEELFSGITRLLHYSLHDIEAFVPPTIIEQMCFKTLAETHPADKKLRDFAVNCATRQILEVMENPEFLVIHISGRDSIRVTSALKDLPQIRERFNTVAIVQPDSPIIDGPTMMETIDRKIAKELGLSDTRELNIFLKNTSFLIILDGRFDPEGRFGRVGMSELGNPWWNSKHIQKIVCATPSMGVLQRIQMDLEIQMKDHLLSWELFRLNVGKVVESSGFQNRGKVVVEKCCGHLLAVALMGRALKMVYDVSIWDRASYTLSLPHTSQMKDGALFNALAFVLEGSVSASAEECLKHSAFHMEREGMSKADLILLWIKHGLISTSDEGEKIVGDLVSAFLLDSLQNGYSIRMRHEIRELLVDRGFLLQGGKGLTTAPKDDAWEEAKQIHLMNNKFSELPTSPNCPQLSHLLLQNNPFLRVIPPLFFQGMPMLQILDLSHTKIRSLSHSLYGLKQLQQLHLRGCQRFMELPPEVGKLGNLKVLDLEGTEIRRLPVDVGKLTNLTCLKIWFNGDDRKDNRYSNRIIPRGVISDLSQLEELIIEVDPNDERWNAIAKDVVEEVSKLDRLKSLRLYLPEVSLLNDLGGGSSEKLLGMHFRFTVGTHQKRIICRPPIEPSVGFEEAERWLKYVNGGEAVPTKIKELIHQATALFLNRHTTATTLSDFGFENMWNLKFCMLSECNEIQWIAGADAERYCCKLPNLEYLNLHYMKNLRGIWKWPLGFQSLPVLKALVLYACPQLTTIFSRGSLLKLRNLEELVVEDCPKIESIVATEPSDDGKDYSFKKLKKIKLHYLPKLVSISDCQCISHVLEWMSFYDCQSLETVSHEEFGSNELKVIAGEAEWWRELKWSNDFKPPHLDAIFVPIEDDRDFITQLKEIHDTKLMEEAGRGPVDALLAPAAVEDGTSSKQKQVN